ncbi:MAG TPA: hypothetical protein VHC49_24370 [Mycobacteriales bacterium]|nr:hypothetical protein [Mycobacteriales bacterium]
MTLNGTTALTDLHRQRWSFVPGALPDTAPLVRAAPDRWMTDESPDGSNVTYSSSSTGEALANCADPVQDLARSVVDQLAGDEAVPMFNEAAWNRYQPGRGHISLHRDPPGAGGVIAVFTLYGEAVFTVESQAEFTVAGGDLVLLAGTGWPESGAQCVRHGASIPITGERMILTFRFNVNGAGAAYF